MHHRAEPEHTESCAVIMGCSCQADQQAAGAPAADAKSGKDGKPRVEVGSLEEVLVGAAISVIQNSCPGVQHSMVAAQPSPASIPTAAAAGVANDS